MERIGSAFGYVENLSTGVAPVLGTEVIGDDFDLFNGREIQRSERAAGAGDAYIGCGDSIYHEVVAASASAVGVETARAEEGVICRNRGDARSAEGKEVGIAADGDFLNGLTCDRGLQLRIFNVDAGNRSGDFNHLCYSADFQFEVDGCDFAGFDFSAGLACGKTGRFTFCRKMEKSGLVSMLSERCPVSITGVGILPLINADERR